MTISVGVLRPGATQAAVDALNLQISEFEAKYPWITVKPDGIQLDGARLHGDARGRHAPDRVHDPVHRRQGPDRPGPDREHQRPRPRARLRRQVQPQRHRQRPGRGRHDPRRPDRGLRHVADLQLQPVHAGRPRPDQAAHDLGRGPRRGQDHRRQDRHRRLRRDGHREHRRLAAHDLDLRQRRPDGDRRRRRQGHRDAQQRRHQEGPRAAQGDALGGQLAGLDLRLRLGLDQPGLRLGAGRHVHRRLRPVHGDGPEQRHQARGLLRHGHPPRGRPRPASSAAAPWRRSTSSPTRPSATPQSTGSTSTTCRSC